MTFLQSLLRLYWLPTLWLLFWMAAMTAFGAAAGIAGALAVMWWAR